MDKPKALIIYHSGTGCTGFTAEVLRQYVENHFDTDIVSISSGFDYSIIYNYDVIIFGFPTYHCEPSSSMVNFINAMPPSNKRLKAYFFTSYALYTGNSMRIFYSLLKAKNIDSLGYCQFRSPATDGVLMFPSFLKFMFRYEKKYMHKISKFINKVIRYQSLSAYRKPFYKWYVPLNEIAKYFGEREYYKMRDKMYINPERCVNCGMCIDKCIRNCWKEGEPLPLFDPHSCEFCLGCIHRCPEKAILYSTKMADKPRLNSSFFKKLKESMSIDSA